MRFEEIQKRFDVLFREVNKVVVGQQDVIEQVMAAILCDGTSAPCSGTSNVGSRASDGQGYVKVNLSAQKSVSVPTLPVDPLNSTANHYAYCSDGNAWEINTVLESEQQKLKMANDGGDENNQDASGRYEVGSNLTLINAAGSPCAY